MATEQLPVTVDLKAYRGDTWRQVFHLKEDGAAKDLTDATVESQARSRKDKSLSTLITEIPDPANGEIAIGLPAMSLVVGDYDYDVEITIGEVVTTWIKGKLKVVRDVTNELQ